jgi:hypothetical protein
MRTNFVLSVACAMLLGTASLHAATAQQDKMKSCNAEAGQKSLKGEERKSFMKTCLSAAAPPAANSQQNRMKTCNADPKAKALKGEERKTFMRACLSGS